MVDHRRILHAGALSVAFAGLAGAGEPLPANFLALGDGEPGYALLVEKETEKLFLYRGEPERPPELVRSWNATTGQNGGDKVVRGDHKTPEGIYFFTRILDDAELPAEYGVRALVMDYPNLFDRRAGKTGDGIWLHATDELVRPLTSRQTRGCVVVTNRDVMEISRYVRLDSTPIVVQERVDRLAPEAWSRERQAVLDVLEGWRAAWERGDMAEYARHYATDFHSEGRDREAWVQRKREIARASGRLGIETLHPTVLRDGERAIARFGQLYRTATRGEYGRKTLWLERQGESWKIVAEDWRREPAPAAVARRVAPLAPAVARTRAETRDRPEPAAQVPVAVAVAAPAGGRRGDSPLAALPGISRPSGARPAPSPAAPPPPRPQPPSLPAEASPQLAALPVAVRAFLADLGPEEARVSFRLEVNGEGPLPARGSLALEVRLRTGSGVERRVWPDRVGGPGGVMPPQASAGDPFSIRRFKLIDARLAGIPAGAVLEGVSLHLFDAAGRPALRHDFGG